MEDVTPIGTQEQLDAIRTHLDKAFGVQDFGEIKAYLGIPFSRTRNHNKAEYTPGAIQIGMRDLMGESTQQF